ncbi:MAG: HAD family hydrolase [Clostridia bacterium]|nr:HAD family hydrolase [Clostridia bacterium]
MTMFQDIKLVMLDLDNTIIKHQEKKERELIANTLGIREDPNFDKELETMFRENSKHISPSMRIGEELFGLIIEFIMPSLKKHGLKGIDVLKGIEEINTSIQMEGSKELLDEIYNKGYKIIAVSDWFFEHQLRTLKRLKISEYFERLYCWDDYYPKINKLAYKRALNGINPNNAIMIGDGYSSDIVSAKSMGINVIGFNVKYPEKAKVKADIDVEELIHILNFI